MNATLYDLTVGERSALDALIELEDGEATPEIETLWHELEGKITAKVLAWAGWIHSKSNVVALLKAEEERIANRRRVIERAIESSKAELSRQMEAAGIEKVPGVTLSVNNQLNNPSLFVHQPVDADRLAELRSSVPWAVRVIPETVELDKRAMLSAAKDGVALPDGFSVVRSRSVRIR